MESQIGFLFVPQGDATTSPPRSALPAPSLPYSPDQSPVRVVQAGQVPTLICIKLAIPTTVCSDTERFFRNDNLTAQPCIPSLSLSSPLAHRLLHICTRDQARATAES